MLTSQKKKPPSIEMEMEEKLLSSSQDSSLNLEIKSFEPDILAEYKAIEKKLNLCIAILKSQIRRKKALKISYYGLNISSMLASLAHIFASVLLYNERVADFNTTTFEKYICNIPGIPTSATTCGDVFNLAHYFKIFSVKNCDKVHSLTEFGQSCLVDLIEKLHDVISDYNQYPGSCALSCQKRIENILSGPGMWDGYLPVIIFLGIAPPAGLITFGLVTPIIDKIAAFLRVEKLSDEKMSTLQRYANEYGIVFSKTADVEVILKLFEERLLLLAKQEPYKSFFRLQSQVSFIMGANEKKAPVRLLFTPAKNNTIPEIKLCKMIFEFAGLADNSEHLAAANPIRKALILSKHSFFTTLNNSKDINGDKIYDGKKIAKNIFQFADIDSKPMRAANG